MKFKYPIFIIVQLALSLCQCDAGFFTRRNSRSSLSYCQKTCTVNDAYFVTSASGNNFSKALGDFKVCLSSQCPLRETVSFWSTFFNNLPAPRNRMELNYLDNKLESLDVAGMGDYLMRFHNDIQLLRQHLSRDGDKSFIRFKQISNRRTRASYN